MPRYSLYQEQQCRKSGWSVRIGQKWKKLSLCCVKHHASDMGVEWTYTSTHSYCGYLDESKWLVICPSSVYSVGSIFCYRLNSRFGGPQSRSRHHGEEIVPSPAGNRIPFPRLLLAITI